MKKNILSLLSFVFLVFITGCGVAPVKPVVEPEPIVVSKTTYMFVPVPDNLLLSCRVEPPPAMKEYLAADWPNKEALLSTYIKSLLGNLAVCNTKFTNLKKWNQSQKDIYDNKAKE